MCCDVVVMCGSGFIFFILVCNNDGVDVVMDIIVSVWRVS